MSTETGRPLALVTGASSGIGREQSGVSRFMPDRLKAQMHLSMAKPGSGD